MSDCSENSSEQGDWEHVENSSSKTDEDLADINTFELDAVVENYVEPLVTQLREELKTLHEDNTVLEEKLAEKGSELELAATALEELREEHARQMGKLSMEHKMDMELKEIECKEHVDELQLLNGKVDGLMKELKMKNVEEGKEKAKEKVKEKDNQVAQKPWMVLVSQKIVQTNKANEQMVMQLYKLCKVCAINSNQNELARRVIGKYKLDQEKESKSLPRGIKFRWTSEGTLSMTRVYPKKRASDPCHLYQFERKLGCKNFEGNSKISYKGSRQTYVFSDFQGSPANSFTLTITGDNGNIRKVAFKRV